MKILQIYIFHRLLTAEWQSGIDKGLKIHYL